jgi:SAM-dependent methyltransferase
MLEKQLWAYRRWRRERKLNALDNIPYNRDLWDSYAQAWSHPDFREGIRDVRELGPERGKARALGEEYGTQADVDQVLGEFLLPHVSPESVVGEIGSGGGRIAAQVAGEVGQLHCFDISAKMLERAKTTLWAKSNVTYTLLDGPQLPAELTDGFDFLYSFDVFPHLDLHTMWKYVQEISRTLKPGGRALVNTANLRSPGGWERFSSQVGYSVEGHYFITPELFRTLLGHAGLKALAEPKPSGDNFYLNRDYVVLFERPGPRSRQKARATRGTRRGSGTASKSAAQKRAAAKRRAPRRSAPEPEPAEQPVPDPATAERAAPEPERSAGEPTPSERALPAQQPVREPATAERARQPVPEPATVERAGPEPEPKRSASEPTPSERPPPDPDRVTFERPVAEPAAGEGVVSERPASEPPESEPARPELGGPDAARPGQDGSSPAS